MEFVDDHRLLVSLEPADDAPPSLAFIDTANGIGSVPMQTSFHLSHHFCGFQHASLLLEPGGHKPFHARSPVPFYEDPAQRIAVLDIQYRSYYLVIRVGALLELLRSHEGSAVGWEEWKSCVMIPSIAPKENIHICVSGCRLFVIHKGGYVPSLQIETYDCSIRGCGKYLGGRVDRGPEQVRCLMSTGKRVQIAFGYELLNTHSGHYGVILYKVSIAVSWTR